MIQFPHREHKHPGLVSNEILYVIAVISNPSRYATRWRLYEQFAKQMQAAPYVKLITVELALGDRFHEISNAANPDHLMIRSAHELWHKESMINLGVRKLPPDWKYAAWIDCDVEFLNRDWSLEALHQLQHHKVIQLFEQAIDLGPHQEVLQVHQGFCAQYFRGAAPVFTTEDYGKPGTFWHPGYAWACRRDFWENLGGLPTWAICGAADHHLALALIGKAQHSLPGNLHKNYDKAVFELQRKALRAGEKNLGFVKGAIAHSFHGAKANRKYVERWSILQKHQFDPETDIGFDDQGLVIMTNSKWGLRDDIRKYFSQRNEDSNEV